MRTYPVCFTLLFLLAGCGERAARVAKDGKPVELHTATVDEVEQVIAKQKGKVVLVDCWGYFCPPCKKEFPRLVDLHERHADEGLVCISVSFDERSDRDDALAFLKRNGASFRNYWLPREEAISASNKWGIDFFPTVLVFDREGKLHPFRDGVSYDDVAELVVQLLAAR